MDEAGHLDIPSAGPHETRAIAAALAGVLGPGDVVSLSGELGAGKTCFVQGAVRALGFTGRVTSPTFTLVRRYDAERLPVVHVDVYRLDGLGDLGDLGDEVLDDEVVTMIEWGDALGPLLPDDRVDVEVALADLAADPAADPTDGLADDLAGRRVRIIGQGRWAERGEVLAGALAAFVPASSVPATGRGGVAEVDAC